MSRLPTMNGAREVILAFLSELKITRRHQIPREDLIKWCLKHQNRFAVKCSEKTYGLQINKMIIGSEKNMKEGHSEGLDNVFCHSSLNSQHVKIAHDSACPF